MGGGRGNGCRRDLPQDAGGVFFDSPGQRVPDPYFGGAGPERTGRTECGNCTVGRRVGAKNTLVKNYLALAERLGVIEPLRTVVTSHRSRLPPTMSRPRMPWRACAAARGRKSRHTVVAREVVIAAGTPGAPSSCCTP